MNVEVKFEGVPQLVAAIKKFEKDSTKRSTLLKIYRQQAKPYLNALKGDSFVPKHRTTSKAAGLKIPPGNLRKSMYTKAVKKANNGYVGVFVGPRISKYANVFDEAKGQKVKKLVGTGYYASFILPGGARKGWQAKAKKTDWRGQAWDSVKNQVEGGMTKELAAYLRKNAKKLGFEVT